MTIKTDNPCNSSPRKRSGWQSQDSLAGPLFFSACVMMGCLIGMVGVALYAVIGAYG